MVVTPQDKTSEIVVYKCPLCSKLFAGNAFVLNHLQRRHKKHPFVPTSVPQRVPVPEQEVPDQILDPATPTSPQVQSPSDAASPSLDLIRADLQRLENDVAHLRTAIRSESHNGDSSPASMPSPENMAEPLNCLPGPSNRSDSSRFENSSSGVPQMITHSTIRQRALEFLQRSAHQMSPVQAQKLAQLKRVELSRDPGFSQNPGNLGRFGNPGGSRRQDSRGDWNWDTLNTGMAANRAGAGENSYIIESEEENFEHANTDSPHRLAVPSTSQLNSGTVQNFHGYSPNSHVAGSDQRLGETGFSGARKFSQSRNSHVRASPPPPPLRPFLTQTWRLRMSQRLNDVLFTYGINPDQKRVSLMQFHAIGTQMRDGRRRIEAQNPYFSPVRNAVNTRIEQQVLAISQPDCRLVSYMRHNVPSMPKNMLVESSGNSPNSRVKTPDSHVYEMPLTKRVIRALDSSLNVSMETLDWSEPDSRVKHGPGPEIDQSSGDFVSKHEYEYPDQDFYSTVKKGKRSKDNNHENQATHVEERTENVADGNLPEKSAARKARRSSQPLRPEVVIFNGEQPQNGVSNGLNVEKSNGVAKPQPEEKSRNLESKKPILFEELSDDDAVSLTRREIFRRNLLQMSRKADKFEEIELKTENLSDISENSLDEALKNEMRNFADLPLPSLKLEGEASKIGSQRHGTPPTGKSDSHSLLLRNPSNSTTVTSSDNTSVWAENHTGQGSFDSTNS